MAVAAAVVGAALMIGGNIKSSLDQAKGEELNAQGYESQAEYAKAVHKRKMYLLERQQKDFAGRQKSMFAKSGVSFSGSVIDVMVDTQSEQRAELMAAQNEANQEVSSYLFQANAARNRAKSLSNPMTMVFQNGGTALSAYAGASKAGGGSGGTTTASSGGGGNNAYAWTNAGRSYAARS